MKKNTLQINSYGSFEKNNLETFIRSIDEDLPHAYIDFLKTYNGGKVTPNCFDISEKEGGATISAFYGLHNGPEFNRLDSVNDVFRGRIPKNSITIACDTTGNQICMRLESKYKGEIYFWDHELESSEKGFIKLSNSLNGFIDMLYEFKLVNDELSEILLSKDEKEWKKLISVYDIEAKDEYGRSLIERAVIKNNLFGVKLLVESCSAQLN
ncbi:SMI1/KNR4 family protein, partial [Pseudoalteromonas luteoviolacea]